MTASPPCWPNQVDALASYGNAIIAAHAKGATTLVDAKDILSGNFVYVSVPDGDRRTRRRRPLSPITSPGCSGPSTGPGRIRMPGPRSSPSRPSSRSSRRRRRSSTAKRSAPASSSPPRPRRSPPSRTSWIPSWQAGIIDKTFDIGDYWTTAFDPDLTDRSRVSTLSADALSRTVADTGSAPGNKVRADDGHRRPAGPVPPPASAARRQGDQPADAAAALVCRQHRGLAVGQRAGVTDGGGRQGGRAAGTGELQEAILASAQRVGLGLLFGLSAAVIAALHLRPVQGRRGRHRRADPDAPHRPRGRPDPAADHLVRHRRPAQTDPDRAGRLLPALPQPVRRHPWHRSRL